MKVLSPREADARALESDWRAVGNDLRWAMSKVDEEIAQSKINNN